MSAPQTVSPSNSRKRRGPRYHTGAADTRPGAGILRDEVALDEFKRHTKGLSGRLRMPSIESMRAGTVLTPHALVRRYLMSARHLGIRKEWAVQFAVWVSRQIDYLWPMEPTPTSELERRAMVHEHADDLAELAHHTTRCRASLLARRDALCREIAADQLLIAKIERELEQAP